MLTLEYKLDVKPAQAAAIEEAIRTVQFIRNKCVRLWMDATKDHPVDRNTLQAYCAVLAAEFPFVAALNSQARQASADRAWFAIDRFYTNCREHRPGKKGYPRFRHNTRSVEYKVTGWKLAEDGRHISFTDGQGIGTVRLIGKKATGIATFPTEAIQRVRIVRRADGYFCEFCVAIEWVVEHQPSGVQRGIDVGLLAYYTDSEGEKVENPRYFRKAEKKVAQLQRRVSRKGVRHKQAKQPKPSRTPNKYPKGQPVVKTEHAPKKQWHTHATTPKTLRRHARRAAHPTPPVVVTPPTPGTPPEAGKQSHNYQKARQKLARAHLHVQRQREDFARDKASALISSSDLIAYEDLQIRNLVKNHHLAKSISDAAWGRFLHWVRYYAAQQGIPCIAVPPQWTSQDCSGILPDGSRCPERIRKSLSVRTHICPRCGLVIDRDHNSGRLILARALAILLASVPSGRREQPGRVPG